MSVRSRARTTAQHILIAHELAVVLANGAFGGLVTRIWRVRASRPFPEVAEHLCQFARPLRDQGPWVKVLLLDKIAGKRKIGRRYLPFRFGRQASARPARVSVGFKITHVTDRLGRIYFAQTGESEAEPVAISLLPVKRRSPFLVMDREPAKRQPELRAFVTAVFHELEIFPIRDESRGEFELFQNYAMPRPFVVESKILFFRACFPLSSSGGEGRGEEVLF